MRATWLGFSLWLTLEFASSLPDNMNPGIFMKSDPSNAAVQVFPQAILAQEGSARVVSESTSGSNV